MNKKQKSEKLIEADKLYEQLKNKHKDFFDKIGDKRLSEISKEEIDYFVTNIFPEIRNIAEKDKEESK
jgi:hypothetical protein